MIEQELYFDGSTPLRYADAGGLLPASAVCELVHPDGSVLQTPTCSLPSLSTTVTSATTTALTLVAVTGLAAGRTIRIVQDGVIYVRRVSRVDGLVVYLSEALQVAPDSGASVVALDVTATITAPGAEYVGADYRIRWTLTDAAGVVQRNAFPAMIVRWPWPAQFPAASEVQRILAEMNQKWSEDRAAALAARAGDKIRGDIIATGRRPSMWLSAEVFRTAADLAIRVELALAGVAFGGQHYEAVREMRFAYDDAMTRAMTGAQARDVNLDGVLDSNERKWNVRTIKVRRG